MKHSITNILLQFFCKVLIQNRGTLNTKCLFQKEILQPTLKLNIQNLYRVVSVGLDDTWSAWR